jgi:transglutaminase-like putative cysteine protease
MNLNNTGRVELDDAVALRVAAIDASGQPKLDLPADQRWRGSVLDWYEHGRWTTMHTMQMRSGRSNQVELPNFGPNQMFLTFTVQPYQAGGLVLAEPIHLGSFPTRLPVIALANEERRRLFFEFTGTVLPQVASDERHHFRYCQVVPSASDPDRVPAEGVWPHLDLLEHLKTVPHAVQDPLQEWTVELLRTLSQRSRYHLPEGVRSTLAKPPQDIHIPRPYWEAVGHALTYYLAHSGEYTYSLEMTRQDPSLDPVLDFLFNIRQGHCERFAAALVLMLRSVGVPARVVKGYHGCDHLGNGEYVVRHSHAHAWVEILVPHSASATGPDLPSRRKPYFDWLTLDATPSEPAALAGSPSWTNSWDNAGRFCLQWWRSLIVDYGGDEQADLWNALMSVRSLSLLSNFALGSAMCGAGYALWLLLRRLRFPGGSIRSRGDVAIYLRLVRILTRYVSLRPSLGQTPLEYSTAAQAILQTRPALASLADVPGRIVGLFYRVRFGRQRLNEGERQQIKSELDRFAEVLRQPQ